MEHGKNVQTKYAETASIKKTQNPKTNKQKKRLKEVIL